MSSWCYLIYTLGTMRTFLWVVLLLDQIVLLFLVGLKLDRYEMSDFAFRRYVDGFSGESAKLQRQLHKMLGEVNLLWRLKLVGSFLVSATLFTHLNSPVLGMVYSLIALLVIVVIARTNTLQRYSTGVFISGLKIILQVTTYLKPLWAIIGVPSYKKNTQPLTHDEFIHQLQGLPSTVLGPVQRQRVETVLASEEKSVKDIMTPKRRVVSVAPNTTLGPIVLSDLEKSGHGYFPVATKKGQPEGLLVLSELANIQQAKQGRVVRDFMSPHISWASQDSSLPELIHILLDEKQYMVLVRDMNEDYVGVVTVADIIRHTLGIVKE